MKAALIAVGTGAAVAFLFGPTIKLGLNLEMLGVPVETAVGIAKYALPIGLAAGVGVYLLVRK